MNLNIEFFFNKNFFFFSVSSIYLCLHIESINSDNSYSTLRINLNFFEYYFYINFILFLSYLLFVLLVNFEGKIH
jgi:hypothetical protein